MGPRCLISFFLLAASRVFLFTNLVIATAYVKCVAACVPAVSLWACTLLLRHTLPPHPHPRGTPLVALRAVCVAAVYKKRTGPPLGLLRPHPPPDQVSQHPAPLFICSPPLPMAESRSSYGFHRKCSWLGCVCAPREQAKPGLIVGTWCDTIRLMGDRCSAPHLTANE